MNFNIFFLFDRVDLNNFYREIAPKNSFIVGDGKGSSHAHNMYQLKEYVNLVKESYYNPKFTIFLNAHGSFYSDTKEHFVGAHGDYSIITKDLILEITKLIGWKPYDLVLNSCHGEALISQLDSSIMPAGSQVVMISDFDKSTYRSEYMHLIGRNFKHKNFTAKEFYEKYLFDLSVKETPTLYTIEEKGADICLPIKGENNYEKLKVSDFEYHYLKSEFIKASYLNENKSRKVFDKMLNSVKNKSLNQIGDPICVQKNDYFNVINAFEKIVTNAKTDIKYLDNHAKIVEEFFTVVKESGVELSDDFTENPLLLKSIIYYRILRDNGDEAAHLWWNNRSLKSDEIDDVEEPESWDSTAETYLKIFLLEAALTLGTASSFLVFTEAFQFAARVIGLDPENLFIGLSAGALFYWFDQDEEPKAIEASLKPDLTEKSFWDDSSCSAINKEIFYLSDGWLSFKNDEFHEPNPYGFHQWASYKLGELRAELAEQNDDGYQCLL